VTVLPFYGADRPDLFQVERRSMDRPARVLVHLDTRLPSGTVLDVGAGDGWTARRLARADRHVIAVEPSPAMLAQTEPDAHVTYVAGEAGALPLATASLDAAYATWAYFFPGFHDPSRGLAELHRVVRPGGPIVVVDNAGDDEFTDLGTAGGGADLDWFEERGFTIDVVDTAFDLRGEDPGLARELFERYLGGPLDAPLREAYGYRVAVAGTVSAGPPPVRIRGMRRQEARRVGELTLAAYDRYGRIEGEYRDFLADPTRRTEGCTAVLVAEVAGPTGDLEVVGTVSYVVPTDAEWEDREVPAGDSGFRVLAVDPAHEGRGIGSALVDACLARAREAGSHRMLIISMEWMHRAHALYTRRYGFVRRPDLDVTFPGGVGVILARDLTDEAPDRFPPPGPVPDQPPWFTDVLQIR
jgi:SAM-dependent methyltransferase/predicted N-acetyltransferase YhbS